MSIAHKALCSQIKVIIQAERNDGRLAIPKGGGVGGAVRGNVTETKQDNLYICRQRVFQV